MMPVISDALYNDLFTLGLVPENLSERVASMTLTLQPGRVATVHLELYTSNVDPDGFHRLVETRRYEVHEVDDGD